MKKLITLCIIVVAICSCHKKMSPQKPSAPIPEIVLDSAAMNMKNAGNMVMVDAGKIVYEAKCGKCHGLKEPVKYTQERWVGIVNWMAPRAKVMDEEKTQVVAYVQHFAKDAIK